jgi:predicted amidohydrolase YtcJ
VLIRDAEVQGRRLDVRVSGTRIAELGAHLPREPLEEVIDAAGGALLPGLHDHHLHLLAMAAAARSVSVGPPEVRSLDALAVALVRAHQTTAHGEWLRAVGYHEGVAGRLDRDVLDRIVTDRPVRVQDRGGALWVLNSAALQAAGLDRVTDPDVERDAAGRLTGRLLRWDANLISPSAPDLGIVGDELAGFGVTGVTDATPDLDPTALALLATAWSTGRLPQRMLLLGAPLDGPLPAGVSAGPYKILLRDHDLPGLDQLSERVAAAHAAGRAVAVHCVTRESLLLTLAALEAAGTRVGDRIEHGAVVAPELYPLLARGGLAPAGLPVVTQPGFIAERGDEYLHDVDPDDLRCLYPYASLLEAGGVVAASSDAPFGNPDPWRVLAAAASRRTESGQPLGLSERVATRTALSGYLSPAGDPGGPPRKLRTGEPADLCLLAVPLEAALRNPSAEFVAVTLCSGTRRFPL